MRLTSQEISIIKQSILDYIYEAKIILFGSRVYDEKKGGDYDDRKYYQRVFLGL